MTVGIPIETLRHFIQALGHQVFGFVHSKRCSVWRVGNGQHKTGGRWASLGPAHGRADHRPATKAYVLPFGKYRSFRIGQLITASRGGGRKTLLSDSTDADGVPQPGNYVKWLCSPAFAHNMTFPHHLRIYLALKEIEGAAWVSLAGETEPWTVEVCADARTLFDAYAASVMTPHAGETDPYVDGALTLP